ncbi:MAG: carbohydrate binding family 9 domain-containing protein [Pseudomonadota bacterium]|nr:carbohydrate binding family 9 domain-containing protein [Pseudomonadota bacterium]
MTPARLLSLLLLLVPAAHAAEPSVGVPRLADGIVVDGVIDDAAWDGAASIALAYEIKPGDNIPAPASTTMRLGYTDDALYLAFHARDPDPALIRAHLTDRDTAFNDDFVGVMLDTFDDNRRNYEFFVNPLGVQMDLIREESTGNEDDSWDGLWTSAGRITADGYEVEIRIPFSTLRFRDTADVRRWGLIAYRNYPRNVRHQFTNVVVPRGGNCLLCQSATIEGMTGVRQGRNLEIVPTLTVTEARSRDARNGRWHGDGVAFEPGVDVAWAPSPNLTLNATINPDFSQVESDQAQLDLTSNFALYFPEKRPFFMEGADYFNTPFQVVYTRQIADPDYGLRITGRTDNGAYGAFVARDATTQLLLPDALGSTIAILDQTADVAAGRYRHDINQHASVGVVATVRRGNDYHNGVVGFDGRWQRGNHTAVAQVLRSQSKYPDALGLIDPEPEGNAWQLDYGYDLRNWSFNAWHTVVDPGFRADLGFIGQVGYDKSLFGGSHTWFGDDDARITSTRLSADFDITHRHDGQLLEREVEAQVRFDGPMQSSFGVQGLARDRYWDGEVFDESYVNVFGNFFALSNVQLGGNVRIGPQIDLFASRTGQGRYIDVWGEMSIGIAHSVEFDLFRQSLERDGGTAFAATVMDTRFSWQIDTRQRLRIAVQTSRIDKDPALYLDPVNEYTRDLAAQIVYSWKLSPRTAVYAGGTLGAFLDDDNPDLFNSGRAAFVKLSYGWQ